MSEIEDLRAKCKRQAEQLRVNEDIIRHKNLQLDALHMVWCSGGCPNGIHRFDKEPITQEMVETVERNTQRLRGWWNSAIFRIDKYPTKDEWYNGYIERIAQKVQLKDGI